jgi:lysophospholipase L1-like esterase
MKLKKTLLLFIVFSLIGSATFLFIRENYHKKIIATAYDRKISAFLSIPRTKNEIIFLGHSQVNEYLLSEYLPEYKIINMGIGGDNILGLIDRVDLALEYQPKCILVEIGINDISNRIAVDTINMQYENLIKILIPPIYYSLIVFGVFPTDNKEYNKTVKIVNDNLRVLSKKYHFMFVDIYPVFQENDVLNPMFDCGDGIHLSGIGYIEWSKIIRNIFYEQRIN